MTPPTPTPHSSGNGRMVHGDVRVQVAQAAERDAGENRVRFERGVMDGLGVSEGQVVELEGRSVIWARATPAPRSEQGLRLARLDAGQQVRLGVSPGIWISVRRAPLRPARALTLVPTTDIDESTYTVEDLRDAFLGTVLLEGDILAADLPEHQERGEGSLSVVGLRLATVRTASERLSRRLFRVDRTDPSLPVRVTSATKIRVVAPD